MGARPSKFVEVFTVGDAQLVLKHGAEHYWLTHDIAPIPVTVTPAASLNGTMLYKSAGKPVQLAYDEAQITRVGGYIAYVTQENVDASWCVHFPVEAKTYHRLKANLGWNPPLFRSRDLMYQPSRAHEDVVFVDGEPYTITKVDIHTYLHRGHINLMVSTHNIVTRNRINVAAINDVYLLPSSPQPDMVVVCTAATYTFKLLPDSDIYETVIQERRIWIQDTRDNHFTHVLKGSRSACQVNIPALVNHLRLQAACLTATDIYLPAGIDMKDIAGKVWLSDTEYPLTDVGYYIYRSRKVMHPIGQEHCAEADLILFHCFDVDRDGKAFP